MFLGPARPLLIMVAILLTWVGDLRNIISPAGYWAVWAAWSIGAILYISTRNDPEGETRIAASTYIYMLASITLIILGFTFSGVINNDAYSLFQAIKIACIAATGLVIYHASCVATTTAIINMSTATVLIMFSLYEISAQFFPDWIITLGDGRTGILISYPGVIWKSGAYFAPFLLAHIFAKERLMLLPVLALAAAVFLVVIDGSRTGFIWLVIALSLIICYKLYSLRINKKLVLILIAISLPIQILFLVSIAGPDDEGLLALSRLREGDDTRTMMISDAILHAKECFPFGCGFGSSVTDTSEGSMVTHNAYLGSLGDTGVIGCFGLIMVIAGSIFTITSKCRQFLSNKSPKNLYLIAASSGVLCFAFTIFFHPFTTEMSEWGQFFVMISLLNAVSRDRYLKIRT